MKRIYGYISLGIMFFTLSACKVDVDLPSINSTLDAPDILESVELVKANEENIVAGELSTDTANIGAKSSLDGADSITCRLPQSEVNPNFSLVSLNSMNQVGPDITRANEERYILEMQEMNERRSQELLSQPGWIRRLTRLTILQDGQEYANESEILIQVGDSDIITQVVEMEGNPNCFCQGGPVAAWARGSESHPIWEMGPEELMNTQVTASNSSGQRPYITGLAPGQPISLDFDFAEFAQNLVAKGASLQHQMIYLDCWYQGEQYSLLDGNHRIEALFKPETGRLRRLQIYDIVDGEIKLVWRIELAKEEKVDG